MTTEAHPAGRDLIDEIADEDDLFGELIHYGTKGRPDLERLEHQCLMYVMAAVAERQARRRLEARGTQG